jgi:hypothetical protein
MKIPGKITLDKIFQERTSLNSNIISKYAIWLYAIRDRPLFMAGGTEEKCLSCMVKILLIPPLKSKKKRNLKYQ